MVRNKKKIIGRGNNMNKNKWIDYEDVKRMI